MMNRLEMIAYRKRLSKELSASMDQYISLHNDATTLDGYFTAEQLRLIADKMDELKKQEKEISNG